MNSKYFLNIIVIMFLSWTVDKLEGMDIFKGSFFEGIWNLKYTLIILIRTNSIKPFELKPLEKKEQIQTGAMQILCMSSFNLFVKKFNNNINWTLSEFFMSF